MSERDNMTLFFIIFQPFFTTTSYSTTSIFNWSRSQSTTTVTPFLLIMVPFYSILIMQYMYNFFFFLSCVLRKGIGFAFLKMSSADFVKLTSMYTNNATITKRTAVEQLSDHLKFACYVSKSWLATSYQNNSSDSHLKRVWFKKECNFAKGENCLVQLSLNY